MYGKTCYNSRSPTCTAGDDEEWSDISCDDDTPQRSEAHDHESTGKTTIAPPSKHLRVILRLNLTSSVPPLLGQDLPPCGPIPQVAYEIVNNQLRELWVKYSDINAPNQTLSSICCLLDVRLNLEAAERAESNQRSDSQGISERGLDILVYKLKWAKYFIREAKTLELRASMSEEELDRQSFRERLYPIPKELDIMLRSSAYRKSVFAMWRDWHEKKRAAQRQDEDEVICDAQEPVHEGACAQDHVAGQRDMEKTEIDGMTPCHTVIHEGDKEEQA